MKKLKVKVKYLNKEASEFGLPKYQYNGDAGADLFCFLNPEEREHGFSVYPGERAIINTGIAIEMPEGWWARIVHRSSSEMRLRLRVIEGTIDQQFRGPLKVQVVNQNTFPVEIKHGDRLCQIIFCEVNQADFEVTEELSPSDRGLLGFGSSGWKSKDKK